MLPRITAAKFLINNIIFSLNYFCHYCVTVKLTLWQYCVLGVYADSFMVDVEHPWIKEGGDASDKPIDSAVFSRLKQFRAMNKLKKLALKV